MPSVRSLTKKDSKTVDGLVLTYTPEVAGATKFQLVTICNEEKEGDLKAPSSKALVADTTASTDKMSVFVYEGKEACSFDVSGLMKFKKFMGAFYIVFGLALVFYGSKSMFYTIGFMVFVIASFVPFVILYNIGAVQDPRASGKVGPFVGVSLACTLVGALTSYFFTKLAKNFTTMILGGIAAGSITSILLASVHAIPGNAKTFLILVGSLVGAYTGKRLEKYIKAAGTAVIGSVILMKGVGSYVGNFPDLFSDHVEIPTDKT